MRKYDVQLDINNKIYTLSISPQRTLLEVLRDDLGLTGTKEGCSEGECGACTVLLDGLPIRSCLLLAVDVRGRKVTTIEGLSKGKELHPIQKAFIEEGAIQCGFCTPGMILSAKAIINSNPFPSEEDIRIGLSGNLCRCTGYVKIIKAVKMAAQRMRREL